MARRSSKILASMLLASGLAGLALAADDTPAATPAAKPAEGRPDWSGFVTVSTTTGEVTKVDADGFTLRVTWQAAQGGSGRPSYGKNHSRQTQSKSPKLMHEDFALTFADQGLVRWKTLPKRTDEKGKILPYTEQEMKAFHKPEGAVYYAADRTELKVGHIVDVTVVRPKTITSDKAQTSDLRVKTAVVVGTDPHPVADGAKKTK